ncbi:MAG: DUF2752 domain-containing protein [Planctomycetes bacterium]|nr:DUF2752 domain-containing protein [Planctomycetota bacterium]
MCNNRDRGGFPLRTRSKLLLGGWSLCLLGGFAVAAGLEPDPRGYGTHQSLGLPPCTIRVMFGLPCPSCGMTTSFSNFIRGQFIGAAQANSAGLLLAVICALQIPWCWVSIYQGRLWRVSRPEVGLVWMLLILCGVSLLQWTLRLFGYWFD